MRFLLISSVLAAGVSSLRLTPRRHTRLHTSSSTHKTLAPGETLLVDTNSLVSWEDSVEFDVRTTGGCCTYRAVPNFAWGVVPPPGRRRRNTRTQVLLRGRGPLQHEADGPRRGLPPELQPREVQELRHRVVPGRVEINQLGYRVRDLITQVSGQPRVGRPRAVRVSRRRRGRPVRRAPGRRH